MRINQKTVHSFCMTAPLPKPPAIHPVALTERKKASLKNKIRSLQLALREDKRKWGGQFHDGRGIRYMAPAVYIELQDYKGGMRYVNWFNKHFKDDAAYGTFFLECCLIAFMAGKPEQAKAFLIKAKLENPVLIQFFLNRNTELNAFHQITPKTEHLIRECEQLPYHNEDPRFLPFVNWLKLVD